MAEPRDLQALRDAIEELDREILGRLRQRMSLAEEVISGQSLALLGEPRALEGKSRVPKGKP